MLGLVGGAFGFGLFRRMVTWSERRWGGIGGQLPWCHERWSGEILRFDVCASWVHCLLLGFVLPGPLGLAPFRPVRSTLPAAQSEA